MKVWGEVHLTIAWVILSMDFDCIL